MKLACIIFIFFTGFFSAQGYTSRWYGMDQGLPQNSIKDITKDKYGFIWLSTDGGVIRYDGKNFLIYNNLKIRTLNFKEFLKSENGEIICYNNDINDCVLISDRTVKVLPKKKVPWPDLRVDNKHYKRFFKTNFTENFYPDVDYYFIQTNSDKYFFRDNHIEHQKKGGIRKKIGTNFLLKNLRNSFEENNIIYIADPQNRKTIILNGDKVLYDNKPSLFNDPKTRIYWHQGNKQAFAINSDNIYLCKIVNGKLALDFLFTYKNIDDGFLNCMYYDKESDKMYFGNLVKGLNIVNLSNFYVSQKNIPFSGEFVYEALPYTFNSVISKQGFEYSRNKVNKIYSAYFNYDKRYLLYDNSYNLLYIEFNKIHRRYRSFQYQKHDSISFSNRNVEGLFKINKHLVVNMADRKHEYYYLNIFPDDQFKKVKNIFRFKDNINSIQALDNDSFYVGTTDGIYLLSLSKNKIIKHFAKGLPIKEIQQTKDGNFWFTAYNKGFYLIKNGDIVRMPNDKDGYIASAHHIMEDHSNFFWISSNNGLYKVSEKMLLDYARDKKATVTYYRYAKEDGLLNNEFNGSANPSGNLLKNGEIVLPSMVGFVFFNPDKIKTYYPKSNQLFIERAKTEKENIYFKDTLRLKSDYKSVDIFLDFPYYQNVKNLYIESRLENNQNNKWKEIKSDRKYILSTISPGNYILYIRFLISKNGEFAYKKIFIEIEPYFYQTIWFKTLLITLGVILIILIQLRTNFLKRMVRTLKHNLESTDQELKITTNRLKNESEYQQKVVESISHDIATPIRFLASISQKLRDTDDTTIQKQYFDGIYKTSEQLFKFTSQLKKYNELYKEESVSDEEHSLYDLIQDKKLLFEQIASDNNTIINNLCDPSIEIKTNKNILAAIIHNLIDNAVKNTKNGEILITSIVQNNTIEIAILDTGKGMSESQIKYYSQVFERTETEGFVFKNYGLGLHMVLQLIKKINAKISFHENTPKGTIVKIFL